MFVCSVSSLVQFFYLKKTIISINVLQYNSKTKHLKTMYEIYIYIFLKFSCSHHQFFFLFRLSVYVCAAVAVGSSHFRPSKLIEWLFMSAARQTGHLSSNTSLIVPFGTSLPPPPPHPLLITSSPQLRFLAHLHAPLPLVIWKENLCSWTWWL